MTRAHGTGPDGARLDLIGQPLDRRIGPAPGLRIVTENEMTTATYDGVYLLDGIPYRMRKGQPLPPGAVPRPDPNAEPETRDEREPETKVEQAPRAPRAKKG
jgi:hypothetical protein